MSLNFSKIAQIAQELFSTQTGEDLANMGLHGTQAIQEGETVARIALEMAKRFAQGAPLTSDTRDLLAPGLEILVCAGVEHYQKS